MELFGWTLLASIVSFVFGSAILHKAHGDDHEK
jgi:hypothetical protein